MNTPQNRPTAAITGTLASRLREQIVRQCLPGDMLPPERLLAEQLSVTRGAIRKVLALLQEEGWLRRMPREGYLVTRPRKNPARTTGIFFPVGPGALLTTAFFRQVHLGIAQTAAQNRRYILNLYGGRLRLPEMIQDVFWSPRMRTVDSLLTLEVFDKQLLAQAARVFPVVCLDMPCQLENVSSVCFDHAASVWMAVKYLIDLGHRRIGYVGTRRSFDPADAERSAAFLKASNCLGCSDPASSFYEPVQRKAAPLVDRWLNTDPERRPTALVVCDCFWELMARLLAAGVRVPADLSLLLVGEIETWPEFSASAQTTLPPTSPLRHSLDIRSPFPNQPAQLACIRPTTVHLSGLEMGKEGMLDLVNRLKDPSLEPKHVVLSPRLVEGDTTRRPSGG